MVSFQFCSALLPHLSFQFDPDQFTLSHPHLPLGFTWKVYVVNLLAYTAGYVRVRISNFRS